jgi:hypothetical protein
VAVESLTRVNKSKPFSHWSVFHGPNDRRKGLELSMKAQMNQRTEGLDSGAEHEAQVKQKTEIALIFGH